MNTPINYKITFERQHYLPHRINQEILSEYKNLDDQKLYEQVGKLNDARTKVCDLLTENCRRIELVSHLIHECDVREHSTFDPRNYIDDRLQEFDMSTIREYIDKSKKELTKDLGKLSRLKSRRRKRLFRLDDQIDAVTHAASDRVNASNKDGKLKTPANPTFVFV